MTDQEARYDRIAEGYAAWWSPIHRPATLSLLDVVDEAGEAAGSPQILDVGCGTGAMTREAAARWRRARVTGADISEGMLGIAWRELAAAPGDIPERVHHVQAPADRLPFDDASFDVVLTAFVLQLVPSRHRALREARRVLRPGGLLAYVTWLEGGSLEADRAYDESLEAFGFEPRSGFGHDLENAAAATAVLRRAGFAGAAARAGELVHRFTPEGSLGFVSRFDDEDLFATMDASTRSALTEDLLGRLRALPHDGLDMRLPIVYAWGRRSGSS